MNYPLVSIIILNWNGLEDTLECLGSVFKMDYPNFKVVVVDNASVDDSVEVIRESYPQVFLIENKENLGYTGGNNVAMKYAMQQNADYLWLLNNDTIVEVDTLSKLVSEAEASSDIGMVSPVIHYYDDPDLIQVYGSYIDMNNLIIKNYSDKELWEKECEGRTVNLWGTALLIKQDVVKTIGCLDEVFFAYWEDTDYSIRVQKAGYRNLICTHAKIYHKNPIHDNKRRGAHYFYYMSRNPYFCMKKHNEGRGKISFLRNYFSYVLDTVGNCHPAINKKGVDACVDGVWAAIRGVNGPWNKDIRMPYFLRKVVLFIFMWHPHFLAFLLRGNFRKIFSEGHKRMQLILKNKTT